MTALSQAGLQPHACSSAASRFFQCLAVYRPRSGVARAADGPTALTLKSRSPTLTVSSPRCSRRCVENGRLSYNIECRVREDSGRHRPKLFGLHGRYASITHRFRVISGCATSVAPYPQSDTMIKSASRAIRDGHQGRIMLSHALLHKPFDLGPQSLEKLSPDRLFNVTTRTVVRMQFPRD
jgi:hypothetical protein